MPEAGELESIEDVARVCEAMGLEETTADYPGPLAPRERVWDGIHATVKAGDYGGILEVRVLGPGSRWQCVVRYRHPAALLRAALTAAGEALAAAASPSGDTADLNPDPRTERGPWEGSPDAGQPPATPPPTALVSTILDSFRSHPAGTWETLAEHVASTLIAEGFVRAGSASPSGDTGQDRATEIDWPRQSTCRHCGEEIDFNEEEGEWWSDSDDVCGTDLDRDHEPLASASPSGDTGRQPQPSGNTAGCPANNLEAALAHILDRGDQDVDWTVLSNDVQDLVGALREIACVTAMSGVDVDDADPQSVVRAVQRLASGDTGQEAQV